MASHSSKKSFWRRASRRPPSRRPRSRRCPIRSGVALRDLRLAALGAIEILLFVIVEFLTQTLVVRRGARGAQMTIVEIEVLVLRLAMRSRGGASELEFAQKVLVLGHWAHSLENLDVDTRLVVLVGGEDRFFSCW